MKDIVWVFRSFGFRAGFQYAWDMLVRLFQRKPLAPTFEELSDEEARQVAWSFGIFQWIDREDLNSKFRSAHNQNYN